MRSGLFALLVVGVCELGFCLEAQAQQTVQVPMPDGVTLATDIWKQDDTPRPVLLRRTPYGRVMPDAAFVLNVLWQGFNIVSQDVRGKGGSGGDFEPFFDDKVDGKATIDWIAAQPWSNGRVATYSASAEGIVQFMAMAGAPEALRCAVPMMATANVYDGLLPGGTWRTELGTYWLNGQGASNVVSLWKSHEARDEYWDDSTLTRAEMANVDNSVFIVGGMFDIFAPNQVQVMRDLQAYAAESARDDMFLILGPWTHGGPGINAGQLEYPADAAYTASGNDLVLYLNWCLKDQDKPAFAPVRYYLSELTDEVIPADSGHPLPRFRATGAWRDATTWPPSESKLREFFTRDAELLHGEHTAAAATSVAVNPADWVPSLGGGNLSTPAGPFEQSDIDARDDVMVFQTEPATEVVEIVGTPYADLWVSSATTDVDVIVRVEVVTPGGKVVAFTDGVQRGRFAADPKLLTPLIPDAPTRFQFPLGPIAVRLPVGHALRIAISGSSDPRYEPNPNTAASLASNPTAVVTTLTLHQDGEHPSRVLLPLLAGELPNTGKEVDEPTSPDSAAPDAGVAADAGLNADGGSGDGDGTSNGDGDSEGGDGDQQGSVNGPPGARDAGCGCRVLPHHDATMPRLTGLLALTTLGLLAARRHRRGRW